MVVTSLSYFCASLMEASKYDARFPVSVTRDFTGEHKSTDRKAGASSRSPRLAEGVDDFAGGVGAARAGETVAWMRAGAAKKKAADRRFVARPVENRPHGEELVKCELTMKNVAAGKTVTCFEVLGRDDLHAFDEAG